MNIDKKYLKWIAEFPIVPIENWTQHSKAINVILKMNELDGQLTPVEIGYGKALGIMISKFESSQLNSKMEMASGNDILTFIMDQHNLSQSQIAEMVGMPRQNINSFLKGSRGLPRTAREKLAARFKLRPELFELNNKQVTA
jgi:antitoxin component HigA of HigAB toxin-antitoxin module